MHGNMVFFRDSIIPTPQQGGCLCVCSVREYMCMVTKIQWVITHAVNIVCGSITILFLLPGLNTASCKSQVLTSEYESSR